MPLTLAGSVNNNFIFVHFCLYNILKITVFFIFFLNSVHGTNMVPFIGHAAFYNRPDIHLSLVEMAIWRATLPFLGTIFFYFGQLFGFLFGRPTTSSNLYATVNIYFSLITHIFKNCIGMIYFFCIKQIFIFIVFF